MLRTGRVIKVFSWDFYNYLKNGSKHETCFTNVSCRHNSAYFIQLWLRLKSVIAARLAYISQIFPSGSKIIQLLFF